MDSKLLEKDKESIIAIVKEMAESMTGAQSSQQPPPKVVAWMVSL